MASNTAVQVATTGSVDWNQVFQTGAVSALTAGLSNYGFFEGGQSLNSLAGISAAPAGATGVSNATGGLSFSWDQVAGVVGRGVVNAGVSSAIQGGDFGEGFISSVVGDYAALGANTIGSQWGNGQNPFMQTLAHAALGASAASLTGGDAAAGAIGGLVEAGIDNTLGQSLRESGTELDQWGKLAYLAGATLAGGVAAEAAGHDGATAALAARNAAANNYLNHVRPNPMRLSEKERYDNAVAACSGGDQAACVTQREWEALSAQQDMELQYACSGGSSEACRVRIQEARAMGNTLYERDGVIYAYSPDTNSRLNTPVLMSSPTNPAMESTFHYQQSNNLSQSLPIAGVVVAPELLAGLGFSKPVIGGVLGGGFDAFGQLTNPNNGDYRAWQTATATATGALLYPFAGRNLWIDSGLGAASGGVVTAATNEIYGRPNTGSNNVEWNAFLGGMFGYLGNRVANRATTLLNDSVPRSIGGGPIDRNVPILLQDFGRPNPLVPYIGTIGTSTGNVVNGIPSLVPGLFPELPQGEKP